MAAQISGAAKAPDPSISPSLDVSHELDLLSSAMAMLASGDARRITLVGLPLEDETLREVGAIVRASGLAMRSSRAEAGCDIIVEVAG
jgi:hypothetical protein